MHAVEDVLKAKEYICSYLSADCLDKINTQLKNFVSKVTNRRRT